MVTMAVQKLTPERRRQLTRDTLLDAAAVVFARRGFHGASLEEIAETAGFTRGAIYKHFTDKEDLLFAVWDRFNDRTLREFSQLLDEEGTQGFEDVHLGSVAAKWQELFTRDRDLLVLGLEFNLYLARNPDVRDRVVARRREGVHRVAQFMEDRAVAAGVELPFAMEDLAQIFLTTSEAFTAAALTDPDVARLYEPFLGLLVRGLLAGERATQPPTAT
jgi:AcrR family transcriptional regulator